FWMPMQSWVSQSVSMAQGWPNFLRPGPALQTLLVQGRPLQQSAILVQAPPACTQPPPMAMSGVGFIGMASSVWPLCLPPPTQTPFMLSQFCAQKEAEFRQLPPAGRHAPLPPPLLPHPASKDRINQEILRIVFIATSESRR